MPSFKLEVEYVGTRYRGWQEQSNARTVQGAICEAVETMLNERPDVMGAGRTDAGVHALRQVAHLRTHKRISAQVLRRGMNDNLPWDINVREVCEVAPSFNARRDARERFYLYQIATRRTAFAKPYVWWVKDKLDVAAMKSAAGLLLGMHDFSAFCEEDDQRTSTLVEVTQSELVASRDLILFRIGASHFLWKMVRRVVGVLVEVGRGKLKPRELQECFGANSFPIASWTAPPSGLFLEYVRYQADPPPPKLSPAFFFR